MHPQRPALLVLLLSALVLALGVPSATQAATSAPRAVSPAANESVPFGDAVVFAMAPEPGHLCSQYMLALDGHADDPHIGPRFEHPSCSVVVALGSELRADAEHCWRVWRPCSSARCNGPGGGWHRSAKRTFHLDSPVIRSTPEDGDTVSELVFPIQLTMNSIAAGASFEIRIGSSEELNALGKLAGPLRSIPTNRSASAMTSHLALVTGLEPGLYYWQWIRKASACGRSATDCPGPVNRLLLDPTGTLPELDVTPPRVRPLAARGRVGKKLRLRYSVLEEQGQGRVKVWIYRNSKARERWQIWLGRTYPRKVFHVTWRPRKAGRYRLCTRARDGARNTSKKRCARVTIAPRNSTRN